MASRSSRAAPSSTTCNPGSASGVAVTCAITAPRKLLARDFWLGFLPGLVLTVAARHRRPSPDGRADDVRRGSQAGTSGLGARAACGCASGAWFPYSLAAPISAC
jgi:hypothetical protein